MKFIMYAFILTIIFLPLWVFVCFACVNGPLQHLAIHWKMAAGVITQMTAKSIAESIYSAVIEGLNKKE